MKKFWIVAVALCLLMTATVGVLTVSAAGVVYGDADGNDKVNNRDLGLLKKYLNGDNVDIDLEAMDVDGNGKVNNRDLGMLKKYLNGDDVTLGPDEPEDGNNIFNDTELKWD